MARGADDRGTTVVRAGVAAAGIALALASAAWIVPSAWPTYAVFFALAFAFSFVWLDSDAPTSVAHMAMATAFVYIAGFPILLFELLARLVAYPLTFAAARRGLVTLPRPLRPLAATDPARARRARLDLAAMLGLATIGSAVRVAVVHAAFAAGVEHLTTTIVLGEPVAYAVMGGLSASLPLPTGEYVVAAPGRLPAEDERVDVIFSAVAIVPFLVLLIVYVWLERGLAGAAAASIGALAPQWVVQLLVRRRHLLDERRQAFERKQEELEEVTYTVTHDVKAPVNSIAVAANRVLDGHADELSEPVRADIVRISRLSAQIVKMIADLLAATKIVSQAEPVVRVDLAAVIAEVVEVLQPQIAARRIRVEVTTPLPVVPGQANKLRHVFLNLIANAIRFVPAETGVVEISALSEDGCVLVTVRDNGVGIPANYQESIFGMFRRVPGSEGDGAGSGMGLAIVKRIVEGHGGKVWVESVPGAGSVFRIRLPAS